MNKRSKQSFSAIENCFSNLLLLFLLLDSCTTGVAHKNACIMRLNERGHANENYYLIMQPIHLGFSSIYADLNAYKMSSNEKFLYEQAALNGQRFVNLNGLEYKLNEISPQGFSPVYNLFVLNRQKAKRFFFFFIEC